YDDYVIYRYGDILLMKAEAKNALGQDPSADINKVRQRAYGTNYPQFVFVNGTKAQNDDLILKERLLETAFEGHYWWDLLRFGKAFELVPSLQSQVGKDYLLLFPIVQSTLSIEPKVKQNPGY
ncbi:MAG: RagB/SusD family nutrient uptake outer membrane protein, partial [Bacteroidota bacterium]|nr:RagB/SusD family nutrient uptake outer membrane protein [Bacteroidota bacterium]